MRATYYRSKNWIVWLRTAFVVAGVAVLTGGATFAAMQTQNAVATGNKITSATAGLLVGDGSVYGSTTPGFTFANVEPGGAPAPAGGSPLYIKNTGSTALTLRIAMGTANVTNPQSVNFAKTSFVVTPVDGGTARTFSLSELQAAFTANTPIVTSITIAAGQTQQLSLQAQMTADAVGSTTSGATISGIDLVFSGVTGS